MIGFKRSHAAHCSLSGRDPQLHFVEQVALAPPEVVIDLQQQQQYEEELNKASAIPLPDADDEDIAE